VVSAFIAAGFALRGQHVFPAAIWLMTSMGKIRTVSTPAITLSGIVHNLVPVTLAHRGAGLVGAVYWTIYRAAFGAGSVVSTWGFVGKPTGSRRQ
jgi:hypothetical protein